MEQNTKNNIALMFSIISLFFVWQNNYISNHISSANIILREQDIHIIANQEGYINEKKIRGDIIRANISNSGKSAGTDIHFIIYNCILFNFENIPCSKIWDESLIGDIQPEDSKTFGIFTVNYDLEISDAKSNKVIDIRQYIGNEQIALIFNVTYTDTLTRESRNKIFLFQYTLGTESASSLVKNDYKKIYPRLIEIIKNTGDKSMAEILPKVDF